MQKTIAVIVVECEVHFSSEVCTMNGLARLGLWRCAVPPLRPSSIARTWRPVVCHQRRHKWFSPLQTFRKRKPFPKRSNVILEEPTEEEESELADIKFVLRSRDIPSRIQTASLQDKFVLVLGDDFPFNHKSLPVVNELFMELYKINNHDLNIMKDTILPYPKIVKLIQRSSSLLMDQDSDHIQIPEYLSVIILHVLRDEPHELSDDLLVIITELGIRLQGGNLAEILKMLAKSRNKRLSPEFVTLLLERLQVSGKLKLETFETINDWSMQNVGLQLLDHKYLKSYLNYVEKLFVNHAPKVHEYLDKERNIFRVQQCTSDLIENVDLSCFNLESLLLLTKFISDLNQANRNSNSQIALQLLLNFLLENHKDQIGAELIRLTDEENELFDGVLIAAWSAGDSFQEVVAGIMKTVSQNSVLVDSTTLAIAQLYSTIVQDHTQKEDLLATQVISMLDESFKSCKDVNKSRAYQYALSIAVFQNVVSPNGEYVKTMQKYFYQDHYLKADALSYKQRIDKALAIGNYKCSVDIFDDSLEDDIAWSEHMDLTIIKTFNDLILKTCEEIEDIEHVFSIFMRIKQQMVNTQCNIYAINALAKRMLAAECVGDTIEMLKRELPEIKKDSAIKITIDNDYDFAYKDLFNTLHDFVVQYNNESTHETNWVLYGEIHKYFSVPFEAYLPAMKFFCEHDRPNAALIIFRQVKKLNELHGHHNYLPPLRDMYIYLFQEFGNRLYEEGVIEVHEAIKMDVSLPKQDIVLQNAILNAYSNLQDVGKARDLFLSMAPLKRVEGGINEETIQIMIKTYTYSDIEYVRSFWNNLSSFGIVPNAHIFRQYLIAHVYHGLPQEAIDLTEEMDDFNLQVDKDTIAALYNFCVTTHDQDMIEEWATLHHPQLWVDVKTNGLLKRSDDYEPETSLLIEGSK